MSAEEGLELNWLSRSTFPAPVSSHLLAASPTLDLAATVSDANALAIRRAHGELVSSSTEKGKVVQALRWKADGQFLAVGWDDGTVRLLGVENTKVVHRINVAQHDSGNDAEPAPITHIGWARNLARKRYHGPKSHVRAELSDPLDAEDGHLANLPHALTFLEIDASLPKISPLPVSGGTGDDMFVFSTTAALESMFPPWKLEDHSVVDVMVVGTKDGHVHLSIYDSFSIGSFGVPIEAPGLKNPGSPVGAFGGQQLVLHASHPEVSTHCLLMGPSQDHGRTTQLFVVPMDLRFVSHSPFDLSLLASKTTTLQKLLRYVKQAQIHMVNEWQGTRELPARFLNFVQQDLQKMGSGPASVVQALYHTVLTGHVYQPVREWLVDSIGDRGHKRWEKAVIPGLESLRDLIHENMLPALERSTLILSRLSGMARFHEQDDHIGFTHADINRLVDVMAALNLVCHKVLLIVMEELDLFRMFSSWLRITVDRVSTSSMSDEIMEKEALLDPAKVLRYIERHLMSSPMATYFAKLPKDAWDEDWASVQDCTRMLDEVDQQLRHEAAGEKFRKSLPQMSFLVDLLTQKADDVFKNIAEAEKRSVRFGRAARVELRRSKDEEPQTFKLFDGKMCPGREVNNHSATMFTAAVSEESPCTCWIGQLDLDIVNGVSRITNERIHPIDLDSKVDGSIIDLKFLNEQILLMLCQPKGEQPHVIEVKYGDTTGFVCSKLDFPEDLTTFAPVRIEALDANDARGYSPPRLCLLGNDGVSYKVYKLTSGHEELLDEVGGSDESSNSLGV